MKNIDSQTLSTITGGNLALTTTSATTGRRPSSSSSATQTALTGITSALDSLKQNQNKNGSMEQLLPVMMMAKWIQNR